MPKLLESESWASILLSAVLALSFSLLGFASAWVLSRRGKLDQATWISLIFAFSMKHTGLALVLAGEVLQDEPRAILIIVQATLLQHIVAGMVDRWLARRGDERRETMPES
jgi:predicted Na+-dependent transporter